MTVSFGIGAVNNFLLAYWPFGTHPTPSVPTEEMDEPVAGCSVMIRAQVLAVAEKTEHLTV
jgi:hypothetical protein